MNERYFRLLASVVALLLHEFETRDSVVRREIISMTPKVRFMTFDRFEATLKMSMNRTWHGGSQTIL